MNTDRQRRATVLVNAMLAEVEIQASGQDRADKFVTDWNRHAGRIAAFENRGESWLGEDHRKAMDMMSKQLLRDPQLESLLQKRVRELGITPRSGMSISQELQHWLGRSRGLDIGM